MKRLTLTIIGLISALFIFCGCENPEKKRYRIGVSQCSNDYWRVKTNEDLQREAMLHDNADLEIRMADSDNKRQIEDIRYFIDNAFDLIIVSPNESGAIAPVLKEAEGKGIPVVTFDRMVEGESFTAHIEVDNYALGEAVGEYILSVMREPIKALEIQGPASASPARLRHSGFMDAIEDKKGVEIIGSVYGNWSGEQAYQLTDSMLKVHPEINFIFAHTDHMGIEASRAARDHGRKDIKVIGIDGFPHIGLQAVKDSILTATFLYTTEGDRIIHTSLDILEGQPFERVTKVAPLSPVNLSNADILISQDSLMTKETEKINLLRGKLDEYWERHSIQSWLLYAVIVILILTGAVAALLLRSVNAGKRHRKTLEQKNSLLQDEKEKQQELYDRLEEATRSKLTFFTNVSHDLRTPLALIAGPVEELSKAEGLRPRELKLAALARKNISILRRLINQILDFRRFENGKTNLSLKEADLSRMLQDWTDSFREVARQRDIKLTFETEDSEPSSLAFDMEKMERVFFNLMSNAIKHTPNNGKIEVRYEGGMENITFSVKDTGTGISPEDCEKIFDRFFQAEGEQPKGSGIGLALTKAFIELHGGSIRVESRIGEGSEFKVMLPVKHCDKKVEYAGGAGITSTAIATELMNVESEVEEVKSDKPLLLVVDDNRDIREMLGSLLGEEYNIIYATDGWKGVRKAVRYVPDLIICDVMMPGMDGMECVRRIREEVSTSHIPVLMLTACSLEEQQARGFNSGADGYLSKPFSNEVLKAQCHSLLANRRRVKEVYGSPDIVRVKDEARPSTIRDAGNDIDNDFYNRFISLVESRLPDSSLSVESLATDMGLSQSQLTRKIKALTNYTPVELIRSYRLRKAKKELETTEKSVSEVAFGVGFTSLAYFSKCYKDIYGVTPTEGRKPHHKQD